MEISKELKSNIGLIDLIRTLTTEEEIKNVVKEGKSKYVYANEKTKRRWDIVANERIEELKNPTKLPETNKTDNIKEKIKRRPVKK